MWRVLPERARQGAVRWSPCLSRQTRPRTFQPHPQSHNPHFEPCSHSSHNTRANFSLVNPAPWLTQTFSLFRRTKLHLEWRPSKPALPGLRQCLELAQTNATNSFPPNHREPQTLFYQTESAKTRAITAWQARWHNAPPHPGLALPAPLSRVMRSSSLAQPDFVPQTAAQPAGSGPKALSTSLSSPP